MAGGNESTSRNFLESFDDEDFPLESNGQLQRVEDQLLPVQNGKNQLGGGSELLLVSLVEAVCTLAEPTDERQQKLFAAMSERLVHLGLIPPICFGEELAVVRDKLKLGMSSLLNETRLAISGIPSSDQSVVAIRKSGSDGLRRSATIGRYQTDFTEQEAIGRGGFGRVFKVVNRLDGVTYAMKKIAFTSAADSDLCVRVLREVKLLAQLNHPNIVRYYQAWLETDDYVAEHRHRTKLSEESSESSGTTDEESLTKDVDIPRLLRRTLSSPLISFREDFVAEADRVVELPTDASRPSVKRRSTRTTSDQPLDSCSHQLMKRNTRGRLKSNSRETASSHRSFSTECVRSRNVVRNDFNDEGSPDLGVSESWGEEVKNNVKTFLPFSRKLVLFVQMELCNLTLRDWISQRNLTTSNESRVDGGLNRYVLKGLVSGLEYLHSRRVIHRDLKPNNVFIRREDFGVLIGDFGLACHSGLPTSDVSSPVESLPESKTLARMSSFHSRGVGTHTYSAPEQLKSHIYDFKVDIYSLGIIMFELYHPMITHMERISGILDLRRGHIDPLLEAKWPLETVVLRQLVDHRPDNRPTAKQLLQLLLNNDTDSFLTSFNTSDDTVTLLQSLV